MHTSIDELPYTNKWHINWMKAKWLRSFVLALTRLVRKGIATKLCRKRIPFIYHASGELWIFFFKKGEFFVPARAIAKLSSHTMQSGIFARCDIIFRAGESRWTHFVASTKKPIYGCIHSSENNSYISFRSVLFLIELSFFHSVYGHSFKIIILFLFHQIHFHFR